MNTRILSAQKAVPSLLWKAVNRTFLFYDACYRLLQRLHPVDDFLYLKKSRYKGVTRTFADGTRLKYGDMIGIIHFNNDYLARAHADADAKGGKRVAFIFAYALIGSMRNLALELERNPSLRELAIISGITWFRPHGNKIGFESEALPEGGRKLLLKNHFRLLLHAMFPQLAKRESARLEPHRFWLTRNRLIESIATKDNHVTRRFSGRSPVKPRTPAGALRQDLPVPSTAADTAEVPGHRILEK